MAVIQQTAEIDETRRFLRLEKPLPASIGSGRVSIRFIITRDAAVPGRFAKPQSGEPLPSIADCKRDAAEKRCRRRAEGRKLFEGLGESLKNAPPFFGGVDGVNCQRTIRDAWAD
ncbi:MAG: hypothetical protein LBT00_10200 [Spirochaetaceae bacterium]|jgi:hypothetical protein|nr:hypothetical protein [Spirochaetaceae bacterium]